jgi:glycosyltransferase involved in cell wall biosynthesis
MNIGVNCLSLSENIGGIKSYFYNLFNELGKRDDNKYIFFYSDSNTDLLDRLQNTKWKNDSINVPQTRSIGKYLRDLDLYFCPFGNLDPKPVPVPSVFTLHDIQEEFFPAFFSQRALLYRKIHYYGSTLMADRTITISDFSRDTIVRFHKRNPSKISRIYESVDDRFYAAGNFPPACLKSDLLGKLPDRYIFYPANRWKHKNHQVLLKSLKLLTEHYREDVYLVLTGFDVENGFDLESACKELSIRDRVIPLTYATIDEMLYLYRHAVCLCFPSLFEGFGLPLVEAMACGCPIVCSNATCIPEIARDAALYFDPHNDVQLARNILTVIRDKELTDILITKGKQRSRVFSADTMAEEHLRVFNEAAAAFSRTKYFFFSFPLFGPLYKGYRAARSSYTIFRTGPILTGPNQ